MIQLFAIAAVGALGIYAYNSYRKHMDALEAEEHEKARGEREPNSGGDLEQDPETGRYRIKK